METDHLSSHSDEKALTEVSETGGPIVRYRLYKRRFAGLVALVSTGF